MNILRKKIYTDSRFPKRLSEGFTLIETIVAILILSMSVGALLTLAAGGFYSVRYARNQIVADNLMQESLEFIRNSRDTAAQQGQTWDSWLQMLNVNQQGVSVPLPANRGCFSSAGCIVDPYTTATTFKECSNPCPFVRLYSQQAFYGYDGIYPFAGLEYSTTTYVRTIKVQPGVNPDHLVVTATITWRNGNNPKTVTQSIIITNWNL